jgi:sugar phosphate isomerase/epimerase
VDYVGFIYRFSDRIFHVHMKDVYWKENPGPIGVFGGHVPLAIQEGTGISESGRGCI